MAANQLSTAELMDALKTGHGLTMADFDRYATRPPMTGERLLSIILALHRLKAEQWAHAKRAAARSQTRAARNRANEVAVTQNGRDWRACAREIEAAGIDPRTGQPWPNRERLKKYLEAKFSRSRSAVNRALGTKSR